MGRTPCCLKMGLNRGPWTPDEDLRLTSYIKSHGEGGWRTLPKKAGLLRCGKSCRLRWMNYLRPDVKRGHISPEEEDLILRLHRLLGNRWSLIAGRMPGRTDNEIKNYWNTHLSKKLISQGIDPRTHKPLSESLDTIICESAGDSDISQKSTQQDVIHGQRENAKDENLPEGTSYCGDLSEGTAAPASANGDLSTINANEDQSTIMNKANNNPSGASVVCNPQPTSGVDFCQVDMSWKPPVASVNLQSENYTRPMEAADTDVLPSVFVECDSDRGNKQMPFALNNLPFTTSFETSGLGVVGHEYCPPYLNNSFEMASAIRGSASQRDTPFYGHYNLSGNGRNNSPFISRNPYREKNQMSSNISLEMPDGLHDSDLGHISTSVPEEAAFMSSNTNAPNQGISAVCGTYTYPITTPVARAAAYGDCNSDTFSSFLESFPNEEFMLPEPASHSASHSMQLCPEPQATSFGYDLWSMLLSPTAQDRPSD